MAKQVKVAGFGGQPTEATAESKSEVQPQVNPRDLILSQAAQALLQVYTPAPMGTQPDELLSTDEIIDHFSALISEVENTEVTTAMQAAGFWFSFTDAGYYWPVLRNK